MLTHVKVAVYSLDSTGYLIANEQTCLLHHFTLRSFCLYTISNIDMGY
jgi:hypothetical protein